MEKIISRTEIDLVAEIVWRLCEHRGKPDARAAVLKLIAELVHAEYIASFVWSEKAQCSTRRCSLNISTEHLDAYDKHFHLVDLVTPAMRPVAAATNVDRVIRRKNLVHSQFYTDFLKPAGMHHGLNVFFFNKGCDIGDLRIWRGPKELPFSENEERLLNELTPYFVKSLTQTSPSDEKLSKRECDVAKLVANGASDKEVARQLGISFTTVRTHLSSAMGKLECVNRTQLSRHF